MQVPITSLERLSDPIERYQRATELLPQVQGLVERLKQIRAGAVLDMHRRHASYATLAHVTGLSRSRVQQLVEAARTEGGMHPP